MILSPRISRCVSLILERDTIDAWRSTTGAFLSLASNAGFQWPHSRCHCYPEGVGAPVMMSRMYCIMVLASVRDSMARGPQAITHICRPIQQLYPCTFHIGQVIFFTVAVRLALMLILLYLVRMGSSTQHNNLRTCVP